jgi:hypothetical protein
MEKSIYAKRWDELKQIYRSLLWIPAFILLGLLSASFNGGRPIPASLDTTVIFWVTAFVLWIVFVLRLSLFRCPRCNYYFFWTWIYGNPFTSRCLRCELPKWAGSGDSSETPTSATGFAADYKDEFKPINRKDS